MSTIARIVTTCQNGRGGPTVNDTRNAMLRLFDRALLHKPDLVCFPEAFLGVGLKKPPAGGLAEPVPGPTTDAFARKAKERRCHVICPIRTKRDGQEWNSAVVIDRRGEIVGVYDKVHPVTTSHDYTVFEHGAAPGAADPPVFDLDFGRIGIQICYDAGFPETWARLAEQGARMVFWPSAYHGGFPLQAYAYVHHYYVITAVRPQTSRIIDPCGRVVAETDTNVNFVMRDVNLDFVVCHYDFNYSVPDLVLDAYPGKVRLTSYRPDGHFIVEPLDPKLTMKQIQAEFGFESTSQYHDRHREAFKRMHDGRRPAPQNALHGDRPMYGKWVAGE
ncbi:MAG: carbon-nitrogen hydrolase family protein [Kiritimatiellae bacterium]|nr:carbon-nitrogen hydrolase family protein [Kiritimatiellia bacterium]